MRLDKLLANMGYGSRKEVKSILKQKKVFINNSVTKDGSMHVDPGIARITVGEDKVQYQKFIYLMMNKAPGYVSATVDNKENTVIDLLSAEHQHFDPFPVGRLDKDTEGLLLLTNDGELGHQLTSPKKKIEKIYYAKIDGHVTEEDVERFAEGLILEDGYHTKPARLSIINTDKQSEIDVTITEGKYHQVKRMFAAVNKKVIYLKRLKMGPIALDPSLTTGQYRKLTDAELAPITRQKNS